MPRASFTVAELARRRGSNVDDVLLLLWDAGVEYPSSPQSLIRPQDRGTAQRVCGLAPAKERTSVSFWLASLEMTPEAFVAYAESLGVRVGVNARRLPKGALVKLQRANPEPALPRVSEIASDTTPTVSEPARRLVWVERGHRRKQLEYLTAEDIEGVHWAIAFDFAESHDPISPAGVRDAGLLQSAASRPLTGSEHELKYPTVEMAAAALMHSIVNNHAFFNGNKRTALVSMLSFLDLNGCVLVTSQRELFQWTLRVASHGLGHDAMIGDPADIEVSQMTDWIVSKTRTIDHSARVMTASAIIRRLDELGCSVSRSGGKVIVSRVVQKSGGVHLRRTETLRYAFPFMGEGRQVARSRINDLRRALRFSEEHGMDAAAFFGIDKSPVDAFISQYRKTLKRLARV